ncbi:MAG: ACT domain-containing protein, partial [Myxococcota bacterium]
MSSEGETPLQRAREALSLALRRGEPGGSVLGQWTDSVREWVVDLVGPVVDAAMSQFGPMALTAVGAMARDELGPASDVDLVLLAGTPHDSASPQAFDDFVASLVHPMWDAGLRPNLVVDDVGAWLDGAADDLPLATGLLDVRHLAGDASLVETLREAGRRRFCGDNRGALLHRLGEEVELRRSRFGGTVYLVEPDLKYGPGGLRDLAVAQWCLRATFGTSSLEALVADGALRGPVANVIAGARDTLLRLRAALHLAANRDQDRFVFQYQELVPPLLGLVEPGEVPDGALVEAIERAMQDYFRAAHDMVRYGQRIRERCMPPPHLAPDPARRIDEWFTIRGGKLHSSGAATFRSAPALALEALALSRDHDVPLSGDTFDSIAEAVAAPAAFALADEPVAQRRMLDLLSEPYDAGNPSALDLCNELGVLERVVPEFGPVRGRMQHDAYHVYTVDHHTLQAVAMLKRIARGEHNKDYPLATALHLEIDDPRVLYLATLVHDTGKALAGDQCETGAEVAIHVARRAGLSEDEAQRCATLVQEHLTMPLLSLKRDLSDPLLIAEFAARIDRHTLRELYLLSLVDTASVRPGNLTSWKLTLLDELYLLTAAYLARGRARPVAVAREGELTGMPERYYSLFHRDLREEHAVLVERLVAEDRHALLDLDTGSGALRLTLVARDRPGLLARAARVLDEHGIEVMAADVFTRPGAPPTAVDVFRVVPREGPEHGIDAEALTQIEEALDTEHPVPDDEELPPRRRGLAVGMVSPPAVEFDTDPSELRSIVDVECEAGPGILRRMTWAFAAMGIEI